MVDPHRDPEPADAVRAPRPGGLLTAAGAVPTGAAVLLAAAQLPGILRAVLGLAVLVIGVSLLRARSTTTGDRLGPGVAAALGAVVVVAGAGLVAGGVAAAVDGSGGGVGAAGAVLLWAGLAAAAVAVLGVPDAGRSTVRAAEALLGATGAGALVALLGAGALDVGATAGAVVVLVAAALATVAAAARRDAGGPRVAAVLAGALLAALHGEVTGLLAALTGSAVPGVGGSSGALVGVETVVVLLLAAVLLVLAAVRRDALVAVLPAAVALQPDVLGRAPAGWSWAVPVLAVVAAVAVGTSTPPRRVAERVVGRLRSARGAGTPDGAAAAGPSPAAPVAAVGVALAVLAVALIGTAPRADGPVVAGFVLAAAAAGIAVRLPGREGAVAAFAAIAAILVARPVASVLAALAPGFAADGPWAALLAAAIHAVAVGALLVRRREAAVLGVGAWALVAQASAATFAAIASGGRVGIGDYLVAFLAVPAAALVVAAALALAAPAGALRRRQAVGAVLAFVAASGAGTIVRVSGILAPGRGEAFLTGGDRVLAVALVVGLALGLALLATTVGRRPSRAVTAGAVLGAAQLALLAGAVGAGVRDVRGAATAPDGLLGLLAGDGDAASGAAWPLLLGVLGAALLAAAWWLESRRPLPAGARFRT